jgi:PKD repeat protein
VLRRDIDSMQTLFFRLNGKLILSSLLVFLTTVKVYPEIIPADRRLIWQGNAGIPGGIPNSSNMTVFATIPVGASRSTVQNALNSCPSNQIVQLSAGNYNWSDTLDWIGVGPGVVLRGAGAGRTIISWSGYSGTSVNFSGVSYNPAPFGVAANLSQDAVKDSSTVTLASVPSWVTVGGLLCVDQLDETAYSDGSNGFNLRTYLGYGQRNMGQINRVVSKTATTITLELPNAWAWKTAQSAQISQIGYDPSKANPRRMCGMEDITLRYTFGPSTDAHPITVQMADRCWFKGLEIDNMPGGRAWYCVYAYRCEWRKCYVHDSHGYAGGQGYGIDLNDNCTGCLVEDNIFRNLHCNGVTIRYAAVGNVVAYNYMKAEDNASAQTTSMSNHGATGWMNLFEGNYTTDKVLGDDTHGSGFANTIHRCVIQGNSYGTGDSVAISLEYYNRYWNIIGNILGNGSQNKYVSYQGNSAAGSQGNIYKIGGAININSDYSTSDAYSYTSGSHVLMQRNYDTFNKAIRDNDPPGQAIGDSTLLNSYYLASKPSYFGSLQWPPYNPSNTIASAISPTNIPAGYRFVFGVDPSTGPKNEVPVPRASATPTNGQAPLIVNFSSAGSVDPEGTSLTYNWTFGDGAVSTAANPLHTYNSAGNYSAQLAVSDGTNTSTSTAIAIKVLITGTNQAPTAAASASPTGGTVPLSVNFSSAGSTDPDGTTLTYNWSFGDGGASTLPNPSYTYQSTGTFSAVLTVSDGTNQKPSIPITISVVPVGGRPSGLIAALGFEEGSGNVAGDVSGHSNGGTITGAIWTNGYFGKALSFGAGSLVTIADSPSLDLTAELTLEAWVYPRSYDGSWMNIMIKPNGDPASANPCFILNGSTPPSLAPSFFVSPATNNVTAGSQLPLNEWSHLAATYDGMLMRLFVNGVEVSSQQLTGPLVTSADSLTIGGNSFSGHNWSGMLDEVRIYGRALNQSEIQFDMTNSVVPLGTKPSAPSGLRVVSGP